MNNADYLLLLQHCLIQSCQNEHHESLRRHTFYTKIKNKIKQLKTKSPAKFSFEIMEYKL